MLASCGVLLLATAAYGQDRTTDPAQWPFSSVGRVNVVTGAGRRSQCTGTLVGPRHVLTAAHCLFNQVRQVWVHPTSVHFVAGYRQGEYRAHSRASSYETGTTDPPRPEAAAHDWALIELGEAIDLKPVKVRASVLSDAAEGSENVVRAGYRGDRSHILTIQRDCATKLVSAPLPLLLHTCSSVQGESGSALLLFGEGEPQIVGVLVATRPGGAGPSIAVPSSAFASALSRVGANRP